MVTSSGFNDPRVRVLLHRGYVGGPLEVPGVGGSEEPKGVSAGYNIVEDGFWKRESGYWQRVSPEVHCHLRSLKRAQLRVVLTAPVDQLLHFLSLCRLINILDQADNSGVVCILQSFTEESTKCNQ